MSDQDADLAVAPPSNKLHPMKQDNKKTGDNDVQEMLDGRSARYRAYCSYFYSGFGGNRCSCPS